jgi:hypothetical protein
VPSYPRVPLPSSEPGADLSRQLHRWASSVPLGDLVAAFGGTRPELPVGELLAWLDDFSAGRWDFRSARQVERDHVAPPSFPPGVAGLVAEVAAALGLVKPAPPRRPVYDHLLVLGGLARACLQRSEHAARLLRSGRVGADQVTALGSFRPLDDAEAGLLPARYEVDAFEAAIRIAFGVTGAADVVRSPGEITPASWTVRVLKTEDGQALQVLAAPSSEPSRRRANTPDTYRFWAREAGLEPGGRVLVVTSPIYVPFQHCDAIRMLALPYGCAVDTVGFDPARATVRQPPGADGTDRYLQEIRSAVRSMRRLHEELR